MVDELIEPHEFVDDCDCHACALVARDRLRKFAQAIMEAWPMGDIDGGHLQDMAVDHGLLRPETRYKPCGESCGCAEYVGAEEFATGVTCYRKTRLLLGHNDD